MKKPIIISAAAAILLFAGNLLSQPADAQLVCGPGTTPNPGGPGGPVPCIPISDGSSSSSESRGRWATRWGAYAIDDETSLVGVGAGEPGKGKAGKAAVAHCAARGGVKCKVAFSYYNQCAVLVVGQKPDGLWINQFLSAATLEKATRLALDSCREDGGSDCVIKFPQCSYPEYVE